MICVLLSHDFNFLLANCIYSYCRIDIIFNITITDAKERLSTCETPHMFTLPAMANGEECEQISLSLRKIPQDAWVHERRLKYPAQRNAQATALLIVKSGVNPRKWLLHHICDARRCRCRRCCTGGGALWKSALAYS